MCYPFLGKTKLISQFCPLKSVRFYSFYPNFFELFFIPIRLSRFITPSIPLRCLVGLDGLEPSTSRLSGARSNHLSYRPLFSGFSFFVHSAFRFRCFPFLSVWESNLIHEQVHAFGLSQPLALAIFNPQCFALLLENWWR